MLLTTIRLHGRAEKRKEILQTVRGVAVQMAKQRGCLHTDLYQDLEDRDILYLINTWQEEDDLEQYKQSRSLSVVLGLEGLLSEAIKIQHAVQCDLAVNNEDESSSCLV